MVSIARKNLFQDLPRFIVAQAGIMFAVGLVTIQTGLLNGFTRSSTMVPGQLQCRFVGGVGGYALSGPDTAPAL